MGRDIQWGLYCMNGSQVRSYKEGTGNALASNNVWALVEDDKEESGLLPWEAVCNVWNRYPVLLKLIPVTTRLCWRIM